MLQYADIISTETLCCGDVFFGRRFVTGDVMLRRPFVWRSFVEETFCMCAFLFLRTKKNCPFRIALCIDIVRNSLYIFPIAALFYTL
jgi:hypothetical protein